MRVNRVMVCYGTRPEAVKLAPVIWALRAAHLEVEVVLTGQHRSMLDQTNELFGIEPDYDLNIISERQTLTDITTKALLGLERVLHEASPDLVMVQGDTTSTFAAALAAFYAKIPVAHVEAGLRTNMALDPYPEELNRRLTTQLTSIHLTPTHQARDNLLREGVGPEAVFVTGNTVIDALHHALQTHGRGLVDDPVLQHIDTNDGPILTVTLHRRESVGRPMEQVVDAVAQLALGRPDLRVVLPMHKNPAVREMIIPRLSHLPNIHLTEPLPYLSFSRLLAASAVVLTDSGGVQEEAPSLGVPVLVARKTTERPEAIAAGTALLVGTETSAVLETVGGLLDDPLRHAEMARATNPYGDGRAAERVAAAVLHVSGSAVRPTDFQPQARASV